MHFKRLDYAGLLLKHRYLCVNSALHYLRSLLRGLKRLELMAYLSIHDFRITTPLRGRKRLSITKELSGVSYFKIITPFRGLKPLIILLQFLRFCALELLSHSGD